MGGVFECVWGQISKLQQLLLCICGLQNDGYSSSSIDLSTYIVRQMLATRTKKHHLITSISYTYSHYQHLRHFHNEFKLFSMPSQIMGFSFTSLASRWSKLDYLSLIFILWLAWIAGQFENENNAERIWFCRNWLDLIWSWILNTCALTW